jgi:hypothetical protein
VDGLMVEAQSITKTYDTGTVRVEALRSVDLRVPRAEMVAIMGPSGCGNTNDPEARPRRPTMSRIVRWSVWMSLGGMATAAIVYVATGSVGWAIVGLVGSGIVFNAVARPGQRSGPSGAG